METIGQILGRTQKMEVQKARGGVTSMRSDNCGQLLIFMGEDQTLPEERELERRTPGAGKQAKRARLNKRIKYWLGRTRNLPASEIYLMMQKAKTGKNPQALFNWLLNSECDRIKKCKNNTEIKAKNDRKNPE